jgi:hypothetical protein
MDVPAASHLAGRRMVVASRGLLKACESRTGADVISRETISEGDEGVETSAGQGPSTGAVLGRPARPELSSVVRIAISIILALVAADPLRGPAPLRAGLQEAPLPDRDAFLARLRAAIRPDDDLRKDFTYTERRRDVKVSPLGKVSVGPVRTFEVFPSPVPGQTYKRLIAIDGRPLSPAELQRRDAEHKRDLESEERRQQRETPAQQARRLERLESERRNTRAILADALAVFEASLLSRDTIDGIATIVVSLTPRENARVTTREGGWMKHFAGRAWFVEEDAQLARLDMQATEDVSIGWGIVGRLHKGSRILVERKGVDGLWLPSRLTFVGSGRTLLFRTFELNVVTEYFDYKRS